MDDLDLLRGYYTANAASAASPYGAAGEVQDGVAVVAPPSQQGNLPLPRGIEGRTPDEVLKEISSGWKGPSGGVSAETEGMPLDVFLEFYGAGRPEDVRVPSWSGPGGFGVDPVMSYPFSQQPQLAQFPFENSIPGFRIGVNGDDGGGGGRGGRGRKRPSLDPADWYRLQRQKRLDKNRESAARSRKRKHASFVELESSVTQLKEENDSLMEEQEKREKERLKLLMKNLIPVTEKKKPRRPLRRTRSW